MLQISNRVAIPIMEIELTAVRAQGPGGQNVNKVASAIHLRFDINRSSLPDWYKQRLLKLNDRRVGADGCIVIKAQRYRSQVQNRAEACERLRELIASVAHTPRKRVPTAPSRAAKARRRQDKKARSQLKRLRGRPTSLD